MEIGILIVVGIVFLFILSRLFADRDTTLLRRVWAANKAGRFDAINPAIDELLKRHKLDKTEGLSDKEKIEFSGNAGELISKAMKFDLKNPNNLGQTVFQDVQQALGRQMEKAGLSDIEIDKI
tara:strand:+ start:111 stop:479 length:369 start_codon:yes stop_codon:yes gene_type:complete